MTLQAVLFDLDRTLWDVGPRPDWDTITALQAAQIEPQLGRLGLAQFDAAELVRQIWAKVGSSLWSRLRRIQGSGAGSTARGSGPRLSRKAASRWLRKRAPRSGPRYTSPCATSMCPPCADAAPTVARLAARGFRIGIVTARPLPAALVLRDLRDQGLPEVFEVVVTSGEVGLAKPHPGSSRSRSRSWEWVPAKS